MNIVPTTEDLSRVAGGVGGVGREEQGRGGGSKLEPHTHVFCGACTAQRADGTAVVRY